jgi:hypothetical protein
MIRNSCLKQGAALAALGLLLSLAGCQSTTYAWETEAMPAVSAAGEGYALTLRYLSEAELEARYGRRDNPFLTVKDRLLAKRTLVFELEAEAERELSLTSDSIELAIGGKTVSPTNQFHLLEYRKLMTGAGRDKEDVDLQDQQRLIQREVLPNSLDLSAGEQARKLVVFVANLSRYGQAQLYIPLFAADGREIETLSFSFTF